MNVKCHSTDMINKQKILANKKRREAITAKLQNEEELRRSHQTDPLLEAFGACVKLMREFNEIERKYPEPPRPIQGCKPKPKSFVGACSVSDILGK